MEWFSEWWSGLGIFLQVMYCIALPATIILIIQAVMIILGFGGDGDMGVDVSDTSGLDAPDVNMINTDIPDIPDAADITDAVTTHDGGNPSDMGTMHFFTIQGFITFLTVFGWSGIICYGSTNNIFLTVIVAFVLGALAMFGVAKLMQLSGKLAQNGTINMRNLLGAKGTVYLVIPASGEGKGKVNITTDERSLEFDAITDGKDSIGNGAEIRVTDIRTGNLLVVEKI